MRIPAEPFDLPLLNALLAQAREENPAQNPAQRWLLLEAAHVVGQTRLVPLGHLSGRLPLGNTGRSNVSAFAAMDVKPEIRALVDNMRRRDPLASTTTARP